MKELIIALLMIVNGEIKEHRIQESMSQCLKGKRVAMRTNKNNNINYTCIKSMAELEKNIDGSLSIKKILSLGHLLFKPKVLQSKKLYNRKKDKYITYKVATKTEE